MNQCLLILSSSCAGLPAGSSGRASWLLKCRRSKCRRLSGPWSRGEIGGMYFHVISTALNQWNAEHG